MISKDFVLAGDAILTVSNDKGEHFTYRVTKKEAEGQYSDAYFVKVLTGPDNNADYRYLGILDKNSGAVKLTRASCAGDDAVSVRVVRWALNLLWNGLPFPSGYGVNHDGRCGRCARLLTTPESVERGIGPECAKLLAF